METDGRLRTSPHREGSFGTTEMARLISERDWSDTPLGPIDDWPEALTQSLSMILHSSFELAIYWGPELVLLYNDAERRTLGALHPEALGQPARAALHEIWDEVGPMLHGVLETGVPTWSEDAPLVLARGRSVEEAYFTWSYSPIFGPSGRPEGVLLVSTETTARVLGERRLRSMYALAKTTAKRRSLDEVWRRCVATVVEDSDIPVAELHLVTGGAAVCVAAAGRGGTSRRVEGLEQRAIARAAALTGGTIVVPARDSWDGGAVSAVIVPLRVRAVTAGTPVLVLGFSPLRHISAGERGYAQLLGRQVAAAANDAVAFGQERAQAHNEGIAQERTRIERDLHDSIQRQLVGARLVTELTRDAMTSDPGHVDEMLGQLSIQLETASRELRAIIAGKQPSLLVNGGLAWALRASVESARLDVTVDGDLGRLAGPVEHELYYAIVEAIQNAVKHGGSQWVGVRFRRLPHAATALVYDAGAGFDAGRAAGGNGLRNMRERLESVGGTCRIRSRVSGGTCVRFTVPL